MPWSPAARPRPARPRLAAADRRGRRRRQAQRDGGLIPPEPPFFDVRTPEYVAFDDDRSATPWECVRGMDHSFGYNAQLAAGATSSPDDELLWSLIDIVAKGGNLLLNVGPRGVDAKSPTSSSPGSSGWEFMDVNEPC